MSSKKKILNIKDPKKAVEYANIFIERIPKESDRILIYGIADVRALEEILNAFPGKDFTVAENVFIVNLLKKIYTGDKYHFVEAEYDSADLALFNENGEIRRMPRFDCAIMNPPYEKWAIVKIMVELIRIVNDTIVNVSQIVQYTDKRNLFDTPNSQFGKLPYSKHLADMGMLTTEQSTEIFGTGVLVGIQTYRLGETFDVGPETYALNKEHKELIAKIMRKSMVDSLEQHKIGKVILRRSDMYNNPDRFLSVTYESQISTNGTITTGFETEQDMMDFYHFWTGNYGRQLIRCWKTDRNVESKYIPYFWAKQGQEKERIMEYFGLTEMEFDELMSIPGPILRKH